MERSSPALDLKAEQDSAALAAWAASLIDMAAKWVTSSFPFTGKTAKNLRRKIGSESVQTQFSKIYFLQIYFLMAINSHTCLASRL
jgi:hypothetical protein